METNDSFGGYYSDRVVRHAAHLALVVVVVKMLAVSKVSRNILVVHIRSVESGYDIFPVESGDDATVGDSTTESVSFKYDDFVSFVRGFQSILPILV